MSDSVDTDALRRMARFFGQGPRAELALTAADEVDRLRVELNEGLAITKQHAKDGARERRLLERDLHRLRAVIENAPHGPLCRWDRIDALAYRGQAANCTCWKADVL